MALEEVTFDLEKTSIEEGVQEMKIVDAREVISKKDDSYYIAISLGDEEGNVVDDLVAWAGPEDANGRRGLPKKSFQRRKRFEFAQAIGAGTTTSLMKDENKRFPDLIGINVMAEIGTRIDKESGYAEPTVKKYFPME